ncbi:membrane-bound lytic murein transglycosylase A [Aliidongia dinghuensis]|uniref:peptidoglycan lytic exotransglycosylase n=1 Tax=Aliidongia dinghuensis TaxID=1867774 RepID=A0A8J2YWL7_9PROT|nr:MltA domain-containing protein [Aliidongia dinghuensis]GGF32665.1 membrane-bound lytic murein transglycosylase A [Aliidongia dinghuensis]
MIGPPVIGWRFLLLGLVAGALAACGAPKPPPDKLVLTRAGFGELPGWAQDDPSAALPVLLKSCAVLLKGTDDQALGLAGQVGDWRAPCADAAQVTPGDQAAARAFFERDFVPFRAANNDKTEGLFTGYYEAELHGSLTHDDRFSVPLYRRPADLVSVDLGQFRPSLKGERIAGRVAGGKLVPYATRTQIEAGALAGKGLELAWVDNSVDAFFLAVQGSGRVILPDGQVMRVGYDGENGQPYVAIGRVLAQQGVPADQITMPFLRQWIADHGTDGTALMDKNPSYIFFRELKGDGPMGAQGVALTPGRSAAVDRSFVPLGLPFWIDTTDPVESSGRLQRLFVAQDVGGAIRGPVRADLFFGYGAEAANHAGLMKGRGSAWLMLPTAAAARQAPGV